MATIFQKITGDNCLILDPREALIYPFNFGSEWTEIRMSMYASLCAASGDNTPPPLNTLADTSASNKFYFGFKTNNNIFPQSPNTLFIGSMIPQAEGTLVSTQAGNLFRVVGSVSNGMSFVYNYNNDFTNEGPMGNTFLTPTGIALNSGYFGFYATKLCITSNGIYSGTNGVISISTNPTPSIAALRSDTSDGNVYGALKTGFYTTNGTSTGAIAPKPDAIFIYFPMYDSRLRIHNLLIEKHR